MNRPTPYLGIVLVLFAGIFVANAFKNQTPLPSSAINAPATSSPLSTAFDSPSSSTTPPVSPSLEVSATKTTASSSVALVPKKNKISSTPVLTVPVVPKSAPIATSTPSPVPVSAAALDTSALVLRNALVNIICYASEGTALHSISGSGVFIDPKGIILTNAHIAQYFLLAKRDVSCVIRSGSPAINSYNAALIYIPTTWLKKNASVLTQSTPNGTGEHDFALLAVTKGATTAPLPIQFPSLPLAKVPPLPGTPIIIASYGAQFLNASQIQSSLFPTVVFGSVKDVFTFVRNTIDVIALGGSAAAQEGSSGGGVSDVSGELVGTITTSTIEGDTSARALSAITASYIRAEYASETGSALDLLLAEPISTSVTSFASQIPALESILTPYLL